MSGSTAIAGGRSIRRAAMRAVTQQLRYFLLGPRLARFAFGPVSQAKLLLLTWVILLKRRSKWRDADIGVFLEVSGRRYRVQLATRTELEVLREVLIEDEYKLVHDPPPQLILDLGAHVGLASLKLRAEYPEARIIAVEADPALIPRLNANVAGLGIEVIHAAMAARSGEWRPFYTSRDSWANGFRQTMPFQSPVNVETLSLPDLLKRAKVEQIDLLKIDIEGAEWEVLVGASLASVDAIICEIHAVGGDPQDLLARLRREFSIEIDRADANLVVFRADRRVAADTRV